MINKISFSGTPQNNSLRKGNVNLGINDVDYGPTDDTGFWNGWDVPNGGYVIYKKSNSGSPLIYVIEDPSNITNYAKEIGSDETTIEGLLEWATTQDDILIVNKNYEDIVTDGLVLNLDAGFTGSYPKTGTTWYDLSGSGNTGTLINGPTFSEEGGGTIVFDGVDDYADLGVIKDYDSIGGWIKTITVSSEQCIISGFMISTDGVRGNIGIQNGYLVWTRPNKRRYTLKLVNDGVWHHFHINKDDTNNFVMYIDGVESPYDTNVGHQRTSNVAVIGARRLSSTYSLFFEGDISNVLMYDRPLTSDEVLQNYNATKGRYTFTFTINTANTSTGSSDANQFTLPLVSTGEYNMVVDWGDGTTDTITSYNQAEITHTYAATGETEINIFGLCKGFRFNNGGDRLKMLDIKNWGCLDISTDASFYGCENMTCSAGDAPIISSTSLSSTFHNCYEFDGKIGNWDVSDVTNLSQLFNGARLFNQPLNDWDTSKVTSLFRTFQSAINFNQNLGKWDVGSVGSMYAMFYLATNFNNGNNPSINNWNVSNVSNMGFAFYATSFNQPIGDWDVSNVKSFWYTFVCPFNQYIGDWDVSNVTDMSHMFQSTPFNQDIGDWDVSNVTNMSSMFYNARSFNQDIGNWDVSNVTNMASMFYLTTSFNQDISGWNVSGVTNMSQMFRQSTSFNQPIGSWDVSEVTTVNGMFRSATSFNQDIGNWDVSSVTDFVNMFLQQGAFNNGGSPSINNWVFSTNPVNMLQLFYNTNFNQPIGNWDVSTVINMNGMFAITPFNQDISNWDVSSVTNMSRMFQFNDSFNQDISNWNVSGVTDMNTMFRDADSFDQDISSWDIDQVTNFNNFMVSATGLSTENYDNLLVAWESQTPQSNITINFGGSQYTLGSAAATARQSLIDNFNWTITDGGGI